MESDQIKKFRQWVVAQAEFKHLLRISEEVGTEIFLVGGIVRDRLLARDTRDVDLTLSFESLKAARIFADRTGGSFVLLRREGEMARVVLQDRTFDFANFRGPDLEDDLRGRDFTVNAIAFSLIQAFAGGEWVPYDPLGGIKDLRKGLLQMTAPDCFEKDPLRMLRAFRLSAQLGLNLDSKTRLAIEKFASSLIRSAAERIHYEWLMLLSQPASFISLQVMEQCGLLKVLFPELGDLKGLEQDRYHHLDVFQHSLLTFHFLEDLIEEAIPLPEDLEREMASYLEENPKKPWLKWAALLHDLGKAVTGRLAKGHWTFYGHAGSSQNLFSSLADRYRLSTREKIFIDRMISWHMRPLFLVQELRNQTLTRRALIRFVREIGPELNGIFLLALADSLAAKGKEKPEDLEDRLKELWRKALSIRDTVIRPLEIVPPLISGKDLIEMGMTPGPLFKTILSEIREEQLEGKVSDRPQALEWIKRRVNLD